tara:strand:+ start:185 stop:364 length:180 start_codon:yes stop_codon:yes gene_type:complete
MASKKTLAKLTALSDIAKHIRRTGKYVSHFKNVFMDATCVCPSSLNTKEVRRLNKELGL